jgi:hypothetical protein
MKTYSHLKQGIAAAVAATAVAALPDAALAQAQSTWDTGKWSYGAELYVYLPSIGGKLNLPLSGGGPGGGISVDADTLLSSLEFAMMGMFEAHNGRWGVYTDLLYLNVGGSKSGTRDFTIGGGALPGTATGDLDLDLKGAIWTLAGEYRLVADPAWTIDALAGARMFSLKPSIDWSVSTSVPGLPGRSGGDEVRQTKWDAIVGVKGRYAFGANRAWYVPFYADVGGGGSDLTWQVAAGVGYNHGNWTFNALWRYLDYDFDDGEAIQDMNFNGPMIGVGYRW